MAKLQRLKDESRIAYIAYHAISNLRAFSISVFRGIVVEGAIVDLLPDDLESVARAILSSRYYDEIRVIVLLSRDVNWFTADLLEAFYNAVRRPVVAISLKDDKASVTCTLGCPIELGWEIVRSCSFKAYTAYLRVLEKTLGDLILGCR